MSQTNMEMRLLEDAIGGGGALDLPDDGVHRVCYVVHGAVTGGAVLHDDQSVLVKGAARLVAAPSGVTIWRFEVAPAGTPHVSLAAASGTTREKLRTPATLPAGDGGLLIRNDSVAFPPGGCAYLHTHQGPGIRCLIEGGIRIDTMGHSASYGPGGAWFEGGPEPVFAQAAADRPSRFIRVMVLPARLKGLSSISYVNAEDRAKPKSQSYKGYVDEVLNPSS